MSLRTKLGIDLDVDSSGVGRGVNSAESRFSKLGGIGKKAGLALAGGLGLAAAGAVKLAQAAAEDEAGQKRLAKIITNVTGARDKDIASVEDWISRQGVALGVADDDLRPALGRLVAATHDVGKAQQLASLAMDVSAGTGKSLETVTTALAKAQNGSLTGLSRLGVATKDQAGNTLSLDQVTQKLAQTYQGSAATAADTAAGRFGRLKLQLGELGEDIGAKLLPAATSVLGWVNNMLPKGEALAGTIGEKVGPAFQAVASFITEKAVPAGKELFQWYMEKIAPGLKRTLTPILDGLKGVFNKVRDAVYDNRESLGKLWNACKNIVEFVVNKVMPIFGQLSGDTLKVLGSAIAGIIKSIGWFIDKLDKAWGAARKLIDALKTLASLNPFGQHGGSNVAPGPLDNPVPTPGSGPDARIGGTSSTVHHHYYRVEIPGAVVDPSGTVRALKQLFKDEALREGSALAIGAT